MRSLLLPVVLSVVVGASATAPTVSIGDGTLQGGQCNGSSNAVYFKGIPYAQPPTGDLRFAAPKAYAGPYPKKPLVATSSAPTCIQFGTLFTGPAPFSEDCLYLDIWAPATASKGSDLPVKVWVYGGAEDAGGISDPLYDGCNVAKEDALLVTINYRLGPLGFLALNSAGIQGNQGIQDLLLALQWVQDNIVAFGGDPKKVLLHGQSAGATNTFVIAALPQAPKLIKAAISESGGGRDVEKKDVAQTLGENYVKSLGCSTTDASCVRSKSVSDLQTWFTNSTLLNSGIGNFGPLGVASAATSQFAPYLDGQIISTQPSEAGVTVPTVFGSNTQEGSLFAISQYATNPQGPAGATAADYNKFLQANFGSNISSLILEHYPVGAFNSSSFPAFAAMAAVVTDYSYFCPAYRGLVRAAQKGVPAWTYLFNHTPSCQWFSTLPQAAISFVGATHTAEIPFVFGNLFDQPGGNGTCNGTGQEFTLSQTMIQAWTNMAATANPAGNGVQWPQWNASSSQGLNILNGTSVGLVNYTNCQLWDQVNQILLSSTTNSSTNATSTTTGSGASSPTPTKGAASLVVLPSTVTWSVAGVLLLLSSLLL